MILILALPLMYTIPLFFFIPNSPLFWPQTDSIWNLYDRITLGDFLLLYLFIKSLPKLLKYRSTRWKNILPFISFHFLLLIISLYHYFSSGLNNTDLFTVIRTAYTIPLFYTIMTIPNFKTTSKDYAILLFSFLILIFFFGTFTKTPLFNYLPTYKGYLDILVWRFKGLSPNTNNFITGIFCSFAMFCLVKSPIKKLNRWDLYIFIVLTILVLLTKGRNSGLILTLISFVILYKYSYKKLGTVVIISFLFLNLLSLRYDLISSKFFWPNLNLNPSSYTLAHKPYLEIAKDSGFLGNSKSTTLSILPKYIEEDKIFEVVKKRGLVKHQKESYIKYFSNFVSPHSTFLEFWVYFGFSSFILFIFLIIILFFRYKKQFSSGYQIHIFFISIIQYFSLETSRISWSLFFIFIIFINQNLIFSKYTTKNFINNPDE